MKTHSLKASEINKKWLIIDAKDLVLGRLASRIALILRGKHKPTFTPNMDCGDHVIVINAKHVALTGRKMEQKTFYWHTGHPGGIKSQTAEKTLAGRFPERLLERAVERMLPGGPLSRAQMRHLFIYADETHPHIAQQPEPIDIAGMNRKNVRS